MQVKKALLKQGEIALASAALLPDPKPRLPIKKPPQLQALAIANDSFHTPTTQRVPALGIPSGSHPTSASTVGTGTGTGPKHAALTAQGLDISAGGGGKTKRDPSSRLLDSNTNNTIASGSNHGNNLGSKNINNIAPANGKSSSRVAPAGPLPGWKQVVHSSSEDLASLPIARSTKAQNNPGTTTNQSRQYQQTQLVSQRSRRPRKVSRLINVSGVHGSDLLPNEGSGKAKEQIESETKDIYNLKIIQPSSKIPSDAQPSAENTQYEKQDTNPIIASPTQSPPVKLALPCIIESPGDRYNTATKAPRYGLHLQPPPEHEQTLPQVQSNEKDYPNEQPSAGQWHQQRVEETPMAHHRNAARSSHQRRVTNPIHDTEGQEDSPSTYQLDIVRPTPPGERTQRQIGPRSRGVLPMNDTIPATPAGLFDVSETPGAAEYPDNSNLRLHRITGTMLAHDMSNKLIHGVFSPLTEHHLGEEKSAQMEEAQMEVFAVLEGGEKAAVGMNTDNTNNVINNVNSAKQDEEHKNNSTSDSQSSGGRLQKRSRRRPPSQSLHPNNNKVTDIIGAKGSSGPGRVLSSEVDDLYAGTCIAESEPLVLPPRVQPSIQRAVQLPIDRISALLAAEGVPETAPGSMEPLDKIDYMDVDEDPEAEPGTIGRSEYGGNHETLGDRRVHQEEDQFAVTAVVGQRRGQGRAETCGFYSTSLLGHGGSLQVPPHTALPTLRPFSSMLSSSMPVSTDRRLRFFSAHGEVTPAPARVAPGTTARKAGIAGGGLFSAGRSAGTTPGLKNFQATAAVAAATTPATALRSAIRLSSCPVAAPDEPFSLKLRLPQPVLAVITSLDKQYMAVLLGSHADWEPSEILLFSLSLDTSTAPLDSTTSCVEAVTAAAVAAGGLRGGKDTRSGENENLLPSLAATAIAIQRNKEKNKENLPMNPEETAPFAVPRAASATVIASMTVQRSRHAEGLPITPSSMALASSKKGHPVLILSAVYELTEGPPSLGRPTIFAIACSRNNPAAAATTGATEEGATNADAAGSWATTVLGVESDDPLFSVAVNGPHSIIAAGDGSIGAAIINFDPFWRSYTWGKSFAPAVMAAGAIDDVCTLFLVPASSASATGRKQEKFPTSTTADPTILIGLSGSGMMGAWNMTTRECIAVNGDVRYAVRAAVHMTSFGGDISTKEEVSSTAQQQQRFIVLLQSRGSSHGETSVGVASLSTTESGFTLGDTILSSATGVTALGCLTQDTVLLGYWDGTVRVWNIETGKCSFPIDVCSGAAVTCFAQIESRSRVCGSGTMVDDVESDMLRRAERAVGVVVTSIAGDCVVIDGKELLESIH